MCLGCPGTSTPKVNLPHYDLSVPAILQKAELQEVFALKEKCNADEVTLNGVTYSPGAIQFAAFTGTAHKSHPHEYHGTLSFFHSKDASCQRVSFNSVNNKG